MKLCPLLLKVLITICGVITKRGFNSWGQGQENMKAWTITVHDDIIKWRSTSDLFPVWLLWVYSVVTFLHGVIYSFLWKQEKRGLLLLFLHKVQQSGGSSSEQPNVEAEGRRAARSWSVTQQHNKVLRSAAEFHGVCVCVWLSLHRVSLSLHPGFFPRQWESQHRRSLGKVK